MLPQSTVSYLKNPITVEYLLTRSHKQRLKQCYQKLY